MFLRRPPASIVGMAPAPRIPPELTKGPFTVGEAGRHGVSRAQLLGASWRRLGGGLYSWREIADAPITRLIAAKRRLPATAVFTGPTAAWLHGLDMTPCNPIEAAVPKTSHISRLVGIAVRRSSIPGTETSTLRGLRVTSAVRTVAVLACRLPLIDTVALLDTALRRRLVNDEHLLHWVNTHPAYRGIRRLKNAFELTDPAAESVMETRLPLAVSPGGTSASESSTVASR